MTLPKEIIKKLTFMLRHDYANPNARLSLNRNECIAVMKYIKEHQDPISIKTSEHCITCYNDDNEIIPAEFTVITKYSRFSRPFCRHHFVVWLDLFMHKNVGADRWIHYEMRRLKNV